MNNSLINDLTQGSVPKQLVRFAAPLFFSNLLQVVYNMVDMIVVGKALGEVGLSAVSIGSDVTTLLTFIAMGFANAGQVIIARQIGAGDKDKLGRFIGTMVTFLIIVAMVLSGLGLLLRNRLLMLMNTPAAALADAVAYSTVCMSGLVFIYGYNVISSILRGIGDSHHPFVFISIAAALNIILDVILVFGFGMRALGAALATVVSQTVSFICGAVFLLHNRQRLGFPIGLKDFVPDRASLTALLGLGIPMAIRSASVHFSKLFVNSWINSYGVVVSAVAGIGNKINNVTNLFSTAIATAASSMVGQNIGAKKHARVSAILLTSFGVTLSIALMLSILLCLFPQQVFLLFIDEYDAAIMSVVMKFLPVIYISFLASACRAPMTGLINGSGNVRINFAVALLDGIVLRIGLALFMGLALHMGYVGFWYGDAIAGFTPFVIGLIYYISGKWKHKS